MKQIYSYILDGIASLKGIERSSSAFSDYLSSLRPVVKDLRKAFQANSISVDYTNTDIQAAYLIAYFPQYAEMTLKALEELDLKLHPSIQRNFQACLFGAGPLPEVIGVILFLSKNYPNVNVLNIHVYDIAAETWKDSHYVIEKYVIPHLWSGVVNLNFQTLDICEERAFLSIKEIIESSHLSIFQNCLNELKQNAIALDNIRYLLTLMPYNTSLIINDLAEYRTVFEMKEKVERCVQDINLKSYNTYKMPAFLIRSPRDGRIDFRTQLELPLEISRNLLTGTDGLIPRRNVKCNFIGIHRLLTAENEASLLTRHKNEQELILRERIDEQIKSSIKKLNHKINEVNNAVPKLVVNEFANLNAQIKVLRIALFLSSIISFVSIVIAAISLLK